MHTFNSFNLQLGGIERCLLYLAVALVLLASEGHSSSSSALVAAADTDSFTLAGKSIYFIVTDRFAKTSASDSNEFCDNDAFWVN